MAIVIRESSVTPVPASSGAAGWSRRRRPLSTRSMTSAAVKVLLRDAAAKGVPGRTGVPLATSARPATPVQRVPSRRIRVAETPGVPVSVRHVAIRASSATKSAAAGSVAGTGACEAPG